MADIPEKKKLGTIVEDYALRPVPESERKGWLATICVGLLQRGYWRYGYGNSIGRKLGF